MHGGVKKYIEVEVEGWANKGIVDRRVERGVRQAQREAKREAERRAKR